MMVFKVPKGIFFNNFTLKKSLLEIFRDSLLDTVTKLIIDMLLKGSIPKYFPNSARMKIFKKLIG